MVLVNSYRRVVAAIEAAPLGGCAAERQHSEASA